jgi:hypothetical protein
LDTTVSITTLSLARAPFHDLRRQGRHGHRALLATAAGPLFALDHLHEVACRLDVQPLAFVVADDRCFLSAGPAGVLLAADYFFHARQTLGQRLPARMRFALFRRLARDRFAPRFGRDFVAGGAGLFVGQQFQLQIAERFTLRAQHANALLP